MTGFARALARINEQKYDGAFIGKVKFEVYDDCSKVNYFSKHTKDMNYIHSLTCYFLSSALYYIH